MTTNLQPGVGAPEAGATQQIRQSRPGTGAGSANWLVRTFLAILCVAWMVPVFALLLNSFRPRDEQFDSGWWTALANPFSTGWTIQNYTQVLGNNQAGVNMGKAFVNSFVVAVPATVIPILIAAFAAYSFTFMQWRGRDIVFVIIVGLLVVPNQVALVPLLKLYGSLG